MELLLWAIATTSFSIAAENNLDQTPQRSIETTPVTHQQSSNRCTKKGSKQDCNNLRRDDSKSTKSRIEFPPRIQREHKPFPTLPDERPD